ncbi:hypothetical protein [Paraburkholderia megapolitana]|uniref:hypothetical protein n=1 Tax=Paraburkholderia megapolitana TaxID=420953 RepID=UPI0038B789FB
MTNADRLKRWALGAAIAVATLLPARMALADGWGCQVLLCLSDPRGPETEHECVPPIEKLWDALLHGHPFPTCDFLASLADLPADLRDFIPPEALTVGKGTGAQHTWAGPGYCREDLVGWGGHEQSELVCHASGAIDVHIDGQLYTRVWWGVTGGTEAGNMVSPSGTHTISEYYKGTPPFPAYDPTKAGDEFMQEYQRNTGQYGGGGNGG